MARLLRLSKKILKDSFRTASLGSTLSQKLRLFFLYLIFSIKRAMGKDLLINTYISVKKFNRVANILITNFFTLRAVKDIFAFDLWATDIAASKSPIIFDIGGNIGISALYFMLKYPGATIYVFEPDPELFSVLKQNTGQFSDIIPISVAVGSKNGHEDFYIIPGRRESSSFTKRGDGVKKVRVKVKTIPTLMREYNIDHIDLLKFNIEGAEVDLFKGLKGHSHKIHNMIGEVHFDILKEKKEEFLHIITTVSNTNIYMRSEKRGIFTKKRL